MDRITVVKLEHLMEAKPLDIAASYYLWLMPNRMAREYVKYLTGPYISKLVTPDYTGPIDLYECRGSAQALKAIAELEKSEVFLASKRSNGGNGIWQASFVQYGKFWKFMENDGSLDGGYVFHNSTRLRRLFMSK